MTRIIGIGNRYVDGDALGPLVCDWLGRAALPGDVEVIDGGVGGLNLLPLLDGVDRVILVDRLDGFGQSGEVVVLPAAQVAGLASQRHDHASGLPYLLRAFPLACHRPAADVTVVGVDGAPSDGAVEAVGRATLNTALRSR